MSQVIPFQRSSHAAGPANHPVAADRPCDSEPSEPGAQAARSAAAPRKKEPWAEPLSPAEELQLARDWAQAVINLGPRAAEVLPTRTPFAYCPEPNKRTLQAYDRAFDLAAPFRLLEDDPHLIRDTALYLLGAGLVVIIAVLSGGVHW